MAHRYTVDQVRPPEGPGPRRIYWRWTSAFQYSRASGGAYFAGKRITAIGASVVSGVTVHLSVCLPATVIGPSS